MYKMTNIFHEQNNFDLEIFFADVLSTRKKKTNKQIKQRKKIGQKFYSKPWEGKISRLLKLEDEPMYY